MAFESRTDTPVADAYANGERYQTYMDRTCERLAKDDDVLVDGLSDALYDQRTRDQIVKSIKDGDMLEAMRVMHTHATTTYLNEAAEIIVCKAMYS